MQAERCRFRAEVDLPRSLLFSFLPKLIFAPTISRLSFAVPSAFSYGAVSAESYAVPANQPPGRGINTLPRAHPPISTCVLKPALIICRDSAVSHFHCHSHFHFIY